MNKYASLTPDSLHILRDKGTEPAFSGNYIAADAITQGTYVCRGCGAALFRADNQFTSHCGWPSFEDCIKNAVIEQLDADGRRTEILCAQCLSHLGHVFRGEKITDKNVRHCVNSLAIEFVNNTTLTRTEEIILAAGCFWGVEHLLKDLKGVLKTEVGYTHGHLPYPSYEKVCTQTTGHYEAVRVLFNPDEYSLEDLLKVFFEIHDFTQEDGQGPDQGPQYLSAIFYFNDTQKQTAEKIIHELTTMNYKVATTLKCVTTFWPAEEYHQHYYEQQKKVPYCHVQKPVFRQ